MSVLEVQAQHLNGKMAKLCSRQCCNGRSACARYRVRLFRYMLWSRLVVMHAACGCECEALWKYVLSLKSTNKEVKCGFKGTRWMCPV